VGKVVVVTGAAGGMGRSVADLLSGRTGHHVLVVDLDGVLAAATARDLVAAGHEASAFHCDVADRESVFAAANHAMQFGQIELIVHAAGVAPPAVQDPAAILEVNLFGTIHVLDAFDPQRTGLRSAVVVASSGAYRSFSHPLDRELAHLAPGDGVIDSLLERADVIDRPVAAYALAKRGCLVQVARRCVDWGRLGARVNSVSPGLIADTPMGQRAAGGVASSMGIDSALGRAGLAREVAEVVTFLCSDRAAYVTGVDVLVDGGFVARANYDRPADERADWHAGGVQSHDRD